MYRYLRSLTLIVALMGMTYIIHPASAQTPPVDAWTFNMLDGSTVLPTALSIDFGAFTAGSIPAGQLVNVYGLVTNSADSPDNLLISSYANSWSGVFPVLDGNPFFTPDAGGMGDTVLPGVSNSDKVFLGVFDESAFLNSLAVDGMPYTATIDFTLGADIADVNGGPFAPDGNGDPVTITPGPPSLMVTGTINPAGPGPEPNPGVPEPGVLTTLLGAVCGGGMFLRRKSS